MNSKPAQASMEYVMIAGFVALVIIPTAFIFYRYASDSADEIDQAQIEKFGRDVVSTSETVYYIGAPSRIVIEERLPKNVRSISIDRDPATGTYLFAIAATSESGIVNFTFPTNVNIRGFFRNDDINPGQKSVWIAAQKDSGGQPYVDMRFGNWRRVFVTSAEYASTFGLAGADANCQAAANSAGLGGIWAAWLSTSGTDAKNRIGDHKYVLVNTSLVVAENKADLLDGSLQQIINLTEFGNSAPPTMIWTGTFAGGNSSPDTCTDWGSLAGFALSGALFFPDGSWTASNLFPCSSDANLYCFEK